MVTMTDCERCRGTGFEIASVPGPDGNDVDVAPRCACRKAGPAGASDRLLGSLRTPSRYTRSQEWLPLAKGSGSNARM
jgi:hypothetical protein